MGEEEGRKAALLPKESHHRALDAAGNPCFHRHPLLFLIIGTVVVPAGLPSHAGEVLLCTASCRRG